MTMRVETDLPRTIREMENTWMTLADGCRLAARVWLPVDADAQPVPAILEYLPYRKNDFTAPRDAIHHPYIAAHGYACVRVDMRGSGDSDGILRDEYLPQEQDDALEVIAWIASQPWCTGDVGMIGISWGGFNGLQVAARRPPALKAVISVCSTDDRYADDVHYMGGCVLGDAMLWWATIMIAFNARPPDPAIVGERWRRMWLDRLHDTPPFIETWLRHQRRDAYWQHGSVCYDYAALTCPVYAVGGWADGYSNAVLRLLAGLPGPRKGLIGPWAHLYPHQAVPGPAIGFLQECLRWWDYWLKGIDTGIMNEPMLRVWMQDSIEPHASCTERPGRWVAETAWPSPTIAPRPYVLNAGGLDDTPTAAEEVVYRGAQAAGQDAGLWCAFGGAADLPPDQRLDDGLALTFTSAPLEEPMEILGCPDVTLTVAVDRANALLAARLCDVAPTGASLLVTRGLLNLTHRDSHEHPTPLEPGRRYTVTLRLNAIAHVLPTGHRWRLSISPTYWPWAWPSPAPVTLRIVMGASSHLSLPVRASSAADANLTPFAVAEGAPPLAFAAYHQAPSKRVVRHDVATGRYELIVELPFSNGSFRLPNGLEYEGTGVDTYTIVEGDPLSAQVRCQYTITLGRGDWRTRVEASSTMSADAADFHVTNALDTYEGNVRVFARTWAHTIPRDLV